MAFFACISAVIAFICQPVMDALQNTLQTAARDLFTFLSGRATGEINTRIFSRPSPAEEVPVSSALVIGVEETLLEIQNYLKDEMVATIGICGMGEIGKTTLLQKMNNDCCRSGTRAMFDLVIWVTVSQDVNVPKIQEQMCRRLGLPFSGSDQSAVEEHAKRLFQALSKKRFLLLLDDVWAMLDLVTIGIPVPGSQRNSKVAFTTRSLQLCSDMDADKTVSVRLLNETQSWELFSSKVSSPAVLKSPIILPLAKQVVHKCGGLPLALITVGRAMANRKLPNEWKHAIKALDHSATELQGMDKVISSLKFSYDYLASDEMRSALLFCAMYPEDKEIKRSELIDYWVGEGLLDGDSDVGDEIDDARNRGHVLITNLQSAYLLEAGIGDAEQGVRMHDAVRDMVLWINSHEREKADGFLVLAADRVTKVSKIRGEHVRRIWMCGMDLNAPPSCIPPCPNAWTLLLRDDQLGSLYLQGLFNLMKALRVLDLAGTELQELPKEIGLLVELQRLDLSWTWINSLPKELGNLIKLRQLNLAFTHALRRIPREAIVGLSGLQVLDVCHNGYEWGRHGKKTTLDVMSPQESHDDDNAAGGGGQQLEVGDLEDLVRLQELHISLPTWREFERILGSHKLCRCLRQLHLSDNVVVHGHSSSSRYKEGDNLLQIAINEIGAHLRLLELSGHLPFGEELHFSLDELPCLEELSFSIFESETTRVVLVGSINPESNSNINGRRVVSSSVHSFRKLFMLFYIQLEELILVGRFYSLEVIELRQCGMIENLVLGDDEDDGAARGPEEGREVFNSHFPKLKKLMLIDLPALKSISRRPLLLPSLETVCVTCCGQLGRLPLGPGSAPKLTEISGHQEWWDALEWGSRDGGDVKSIYEPFFRAH